MRLLQKGLHWSSQRRPSHVVWIRTHLLRKQMWTKDSKESTQGTSGQHVFQAHGQLSVLSNVLHSRHIAMSSSEVRAVSSAISQSVSHRWSAKGRRAKAFGRRLSKQTGPVVSVQSGWMQVQDQFKVSHGATCQ